MSPEKDDDKDKRFLGVIADAEPAIVEAETLNELIVIKKKVHVIFIIIVLSLSEVERL